MGGRRLSPGQSVDALEEAIDVIRLLWDVGQPGAASFDSSYYRLRNAARGPAPFHDVGIWVGAYKPRMLNLTGRKADGWLVNERATNSAPELHASQGGESRDRGARA